MKREKTFIKTNIKTKSAILFLIFALFCIFGISACTDDLPQVPKAKITILIINIRQIFLYLIIPICI